LLKGQSREEGGKKATTNSLPVSQLNRSSSSRYQIDNDDDDPNFDRKLDLVTAGAKPRVEIITWNEDKEGSEALFKAAAIARAENQKREREHQQ
jgi:hypothetical protein